MIRLLFAMLLVIVVKPAHAAVWYIDDAGSDTNAGTSVSVPWKTWTYAFAHSACGDILLVMDGTYTTATNGSPVLTKVCTSSTVYSVRAVNERKAQLNGSGVTYTFRVLNSSYIILEGFVFQAADINSGGGASVVQVRSSDHVTVKRSIFQFNNRYFNTHLLEFNNSSFNLSEENEFYNYHRHAMLVYYSFGNILRRNYCNPRSRADIPGGYPPSGGNNSGDDCIAVYPGYENFIENNIADGTGLKGFTNEATSQSTNNGWFGNISNGLDRCITTDARGGTLATMPRSNYIVDLACIVPSVSTLGTAREGVYFRSSKDSQCTNCMILGAPLRGIVADVESGALGDGIYSATITNSLVVGTAATTIGMSLPGTYTWTGTNVNVFSPNTPYSPSSSVNWVSKFTTDPQLGTCKVYRPDGSNAKVNNWGTDILYRWENGVLTTTPLWDPTTGEFPHGAIVDGINNVAGSSVTDIHTRLNVNSGGCPFPAGYGGGGGGPTDPPTHNEFSGTGTITGSVTFPSGKDFAGVFILLRDTAFNAGTVTGITSTCGAQSFTFRTRGRSSPTAAIHNVESWTLAAPVAGTCTISVSTTGTVTSWIMDVYTHDDSSGVGSSASNGATSTANPTVTVSTNAGETCYAAASGSSAATISAGQDQILLLDILLAPARLAISSQSGDVGGVMDYIQGTTSNSAIVATCFIPTSPETPSGATLTQTKAQVFEGRGAENVTRTLAPLNTGATIGETGMATLRFELTQTVSTGTEFSPLLYCRVNGGSYTKAMNTFSGQKFAYHSDNVEIDVPSNGSAATQRLAVGNFSAANSKVLRDEASYLVGALNASDVIEIPVILDVNAMIGDVIDCRIEYVGGVVLTGGYTNVATLTVIGPTSSVGN